MAHLIRIEDENGPSWYRNWMLLSSRKGIYRDGISRIEDGQLQNWI